MRLEELRILVWRQRCALLRKGLGGLLLGRRACLGLLGWRPPRSEAKRLKLPVVFCDGFEALLLICTQSLRVAVLLACCLALVLACFAGSLSGSLSRGCFAFLAFAFAFGCGLGRLGRLPSRGGSGLLRALFSLLRARVLEFTKAFPVMKLKFMFSMYIRE